MKNGEGTCVKGGLVGKCLVSDSKDWKVIVRLQDFCKGDVYGNVYKVRRTPTHIDTLGIRTSTPIHTYAYNIPYAYNTSYANTYAETERKTTLYTMCIPRNELRLL